jgi:hypothetical protein
MPMKIPVNKIKGWQKPTKHIPAIGKLVIIKKKDGQYRFAGLIAKDNKKRFLCWSGSCAINEVARWVYMKV